MRHTMIAWAAAGLIAAPATALAQSVLAVSEGDPGIAVEQRPAFREYVVQQNVPNYTISERVRIGTALPDTGVVVYDVPQRFGQTTRRYTVVNGETVLVEPRTRRVIEVID
ncbi:MAG: DUF1236 domain-containing protein [Rhodopseudomonas palustris]|nr:DUF1236 domain-containing protein [Rhodopseudomonas palustris]